MNCNKCGVGPGEYHEPGCFTERCPICAGQLVSCDCAYEYLQQFYDWTHLPMKHVSGNKIPDDLLLKGYTKVVALMEDKDGDTMIVAHPTSGLPQDIYEKGLTPEMEEKWDAYLQEVGLLPWTGEWPGVAECREFGLYCYSDPEKKSGKYWVQCDKDHPKAQEDLNRLYAEYAWNKDERKFERRTDVENVNN